MGLCQSEEEKKQMKATREIDKALREIYILERKIIKLLLLGTGECGKSTVIKQMKILHSNGFTDEELYNQKAAIYSNTVHSMMTLIKAMHELKICFENPQRTHDVRIVLEVVKHNEESEPFSLELSSALKRLWADEAIRVRTYEKRHEFHLQESAKHFLDDLDRISDSNYKPTAQDVLYTRIKTTGIVEIHFTIKQFNFRVFDVGGQRSDRKKWIHCFENVNSIIYITAVSEYDEVLREDGTTNRLVESVRLFDFICNLPYFIKTSMILFLNKKDLFAEKIPIFPITSAFPEYEGPQTYDDSIIFIKKKFDSKNLNPKKTIYCHQTCATDTNQVQIILESVIRTIINHNLSNSGLR